MDVLHLRRLLASLALAALTAGCAAPRPDATLAGGCPVDAPAAAVPAARAAADAPRRTRNVIVVTIDGVRWQEIFGGADHERARAAGVPACDLVGASTLLPTLGRRLPQTGVVLGAPGHGAMVASGPNFVSLPGYREIFTGRPSARCTSNFCDPIAEPTLLDELRSDDGLEGDAVAVITSWRTIERAAAADPTRITISAGRHGGATRARVRVDDAAAHLLDDGVAAGAYPGWFDYRPDRYTGALALEYLVARQPRFLFVGLGDTDEYAHRGNYKGYLEALAAADRFVGRLFDTLATMGRYGAETTVIVTTDHGRAAGFSGHGGDAPESRRVWLLAAGGAVPARGAVDDADELRLADIAPTVRRWMGLPADRSAGAGRAVAALVTDAPPASLVASAAR